MRSFTLDPAAVNDPGSLGVIENVYETLYTFAGGAADELVPALATGYSVSDDQLVWTFTLRANVRFHSGNELACRDVAYSFKYGALVARPEGAAAALMGRRWLGTEIDAAEPAAFLEKVDWRAIDSIVSCPAGADGLIVEVRLLEPTGALLAILANPGFSVLDSRFAVAGGAWDGTAASWREWVGRDLGSEFLGSNASGTGAYRLDEWSPQGIRASAFSGYWGERPALSQVVIEYVDDQASREQALLAGHADRIEVTERAAAAALAGSDDVTVHEGPDWSFATVTALFFNFDASAGDEEAIGSGQLDGSGIPGDFFADADVRRAFAHLFDQLEFVEAAYGGHGLALTATLPPAFPGYDATAPDRHFDLEAAAEHFKLAHGGRLWDTGFRFTAYYNLVNTIRRDALEMLKSNLELVNPSFKMEVKGLPWGDFLTRLADGRAPLFALTWGGDFADPSAFVTAFFDSDGSFSGRTNVDLPEYQQLIDSAEAIYEPHQRAKHFERLAALQYELAPVVLVPQPTWFIVARSELDGVYFNPMRSGQFLWRDVRK